MRIPIMLLASLLTACTRTAAIAPVPPVMNPATWRGEASDEAVVVDASWWQRFGDPVLSGLVDKALANNSDIGIAAGRVREARGNVRAARATLFPTLDAGMVGGRERTIGAFGNGEVQSFVQPQIQTAYEVDLFGRLGDERSAARSAYLASAAASQGVRLAVASAVASNYIALLGLDQRLDIARKTLAARSTSLKIAMSRVSNGYSPRLELQQARAEYDSTATIIPQIELAIRRIEDGLSQLIGDTPGPIQRGKTLDALTTPEVAAGLPSELLRRRPDITQAEHQLASADQSLAAARKRFLPQIRLNGSVSTALSTLLADPVALWSIGGSILTPIFEGGKLAGQAEAAAGQRDQAAFAYRRAVLAGFREVEDALAAVDRLDAQLALATDQRGTLADALRLATNRYREGYSPYLEQLDAQRQLLAADLNLAQIRADTLSARVQLYQALGGGWNRDMVPTAP